MIEQAIARYEAKAGHKLVRLDLGKRDEWRSHLDARLEKAGTVPALEQTLTTEERMFIRNERVMCALDFRYWSHWATIQRDGGGITNFDHPWGSTELFLSFISKIEQELHDAIARGEMTPYVMPEQTKPAVPGILVAINKARQLAACLVKGTRVLTADLRWVPIEDVKVGDRVVAFDEHVKGGRGSARKLRTATVLNTVDMQAETYAIELKDGSRIIGTPHHKFLCKKRGSTDFCWRQLQEMQLGDKIKRVVSLWPHNSDYEDGWFGGFLDGEGSVRYKSSGGAELSGCQVEGSVLTRAVAYLQKRDYKFRIDIDHRPPGESSKFGARDLHKFCVTRMHDIFRLLGTTRPSRLLETSWWEGKELPNNNGDGFAEVTSVNRSLVLPVYDLHTTTGTYVAEGLASHNTTVGRLITMHRLTTQPQRRALAASVDEDKIQEMYDRDKLVYDNLPFFLKPDILYDEKRGHIHFDKLNSRVLYQVSSQQSGIGVGRQVDIHHLTELSTWLNPQSVELDFFPSIPRSIHTFGLEESTPYGRGNWWHEWTEKVRRGKSDRWRYCYIPWYAELSKYRSLPPPDWRPNDVSLLHAQKVHDTSAQYIGTTIMLPRENLYWWETTRQEYKDGGKLNYFHTNYSATPEESFQHSTISAFSAEFLEELRMRTRAGQAHELVRTA